MSGLFLKQLTRLLGYFFLSCHPPTTLQVYLDDNDVMLKHQSAYRRYHRTKTALVKVYNDLLMATDNGQISAMCLLDLTAAFDTIDYDLLLQRLERGFGIKRLALSWFRSYLDGRTFCVVYAGMMSTTITVTCSVPQGSVLGPLLFILYTADISELAAKHEVTLNALPMTQQQQQYRFCPEHIEVVYRGGEPLDVSQSFKT